MDRVRSQPPSVRRRRRSLAAVKAELDVLETRLRACRQDRTRSAPAARSDDRRARTLREGAGSGGRSSGALVAFRNRHISRRRQTAFPPTQPEPRIIKSTTAGTCVSCAKSYLPGMRITRLGDAWAHSTCHTQGPATRVDFCGDSTQAKILQGETFRGHSKSRWRIGKGPGRNRGKLY